MIRVFCFTAAAILSLAALPCYAAGPRPNVVLISLNALRADRLKTYGYSQDTAPNIGRLALESAVFDRALAQSHWTLPSLASMFTSKYVHSHALYERGGRLSEKEATLAETLKEGGYKTAAFTGGLDMLGVFGLKQGFDVYFDDTGRKPMGSFRELMPKALKWLTEHRAESFFMFLDSYDIHPPFDKPVADGKPSGYSGVLKGRLLDYKLLNSFKDGAFSADGGKIEAGKGDLEYINSRYDSGIAYADRFVGELLAKLSELGLSSNTVIIVTAEHGEELGDHGTFDRFGAGNLYDEVIRVPLIIRLPEKDLKGLRVAAQAQLIDLMPTILDLAGLRAGEGTQGRSLLPQIAGGGTYAAGEKDFNRYVYSEAGRHKWAVSSGKWKLIYENGEYALFNLVDDRAESTNAAAENPAVVYELAQKLMEWRRKTRTLSSPDDTRVPLTWEMKQKLKEAGYWK